MWPQSPGARLLSRFIDIQCHPTRRQPRRLVSPNGTLRIDWRPASSGAGSQLGPSPGRRRSGAHASCSTHRHVAGAHGFVGGGDPVHRRERRDAVRRRQGRVLRARPGLQPASRSPPSTSPRRVSRPATPSPPSMAGGSRPGFTMRRTCRLPGRRPACPSPTG